ncbi:hypothetical protein CHELA20_51355 [Hyphomicrobiales bacterium]|nr:hypothetical protein CHELA41_23659 [Hyphomicrobiales bacterium]CAH1675475.1 hypothetical protein CHELA20_51355 [Hyphomicrobiales bacterium]
MKSGVNNIIFNKYLCNWKALFYFIKSFSWRIFYRRLAERFLLPGLKRLSERVSLPCFNHRMLRLTRLLSEQRAVLKLKM